MKMFLWGVIYGTIGFWCILFIYFSYFSISCQKLVGKPTQKFKLMSCRFIHSNRRWFKLLIYGFLPRYLNVKYNKQLCFVFNNDKWFRVLISCILWSLFGNSNQFFWGKWISISKCMNKPKMLCIFHLWYLFHFFLQLTLALECIHGIQVIYGVWKHYNNALT